MAKPEKADTVVLIWKNPMKYKINAPIYERNWQTTFVAFLFS